MTQHAVLGSDGRRPVVWGLGDTPEEAMADAMEQDGVPDASDLTPRVVTDERAGLIRAGDIDASDLV